MTWLRTMFLLALGVAVGVSASGGMTETAAAPEMPPAYSPPAHDHFTYYPVYDTRTVVRMVTGL